VSYLIVQKPRRGGDWQVASPIFRATEHAAVAAQKAFERGHPGMETGRVWVDLPA
jgi:hypothetical protein